AHACEFAGARNPRRSGWRSTSGNTAGNRPQKKETFQPILQPISEPIAELFVQPFGKVIRKENRAGKRFVQGQEEVPAGAQAGRGRTAWSSQPLSSPAERTAALP